MKGFRREDDYLERRKHLEGLTNEQLKERFWSKIEEIVDPLLKLSYENTTPSIERSVLLRMGFSSLEAAPLVEMAMDQGLIGYGVGHIVYLISKEKGLSVREAGLALLEGEYWQDAKKALGGE